MFAKEEAMRKELHQVEPDEITVAEEIPMDTNPTPDDVTTINEDEEVRLLFQAEDVKEELLIGEDSITVVREETRRTAPPIFVAPAPPYLSPEQEQKLLQQPDEQPRSSGCDSADSTVKENCNIIYIRKADECGVQRVESVVPGGRRESSRWRKERERERKESEKMQKREKEKEREREKEWLKEKEKEREKERASRTPLSTRSIKQFLLRRPSEKRDKKTPPLSRSMMSISPAAVTSSARPQLALPCRHPFAPLAELESSVVGNSPAVEIAPFTTTTTTSAKWPKHGSPGLARRNSECSVKDLMKEVGRQEALLALRSDTNGNATVSGPVEEPKGLIDDEILDQPMLMGDSFPTSESIDRLRTNEATDNESRQPTREHSQKSHCTQPSPSQAKPNPFTSAAIKKEEQTKVIDEGLSEVDDLRSQLVALKHLVLHEDKFEDDSLGNLIRENDALRRQLLEKEAVINALRNQLQHLKMSSSIES